MKKRIEGGKPQNSTANDGSSSIPVHFLLQAPGNGPTKHPTSATGAMQDPNLFSMPVWKGHKRAWRLKQERKRQRDQALKPGDIISVDQMVSPVPGLIAQMVGFLMKQCYKYTTVFVDQAGRMGSIYHQKTCSAEETIEAKRAFEKYAMNR